MASLLPPNSTQLERDIEQVTSRISDVPTPAYSPFDIDAAPAALLPWIAWALSVDRWDPDWPVSTKREVLKASVEVHRHKGTKSAIRAAIAAAGYEIQQIVEGGYSAVRDGSYTHDGTLTHGQAAHWADYNIIMREPITNDQAAQIRSILSTVQPARCRLLQLIYPEAVALHDGSIFRDGTYNHGAA